MNQTFALECLFLLLTARRLIAENSIVTGSEEDDSTSRDMDRGRLAVTWIDIFTWTIMKGSQLLQKANERTEWRSIVSECDQASSVRMV